jgi:putative DNA methylase
MMAGPQGIKKKLIEVALPLEAINRESAREKSIRHGHPSTLHLWWARRPLAACRAVLFASLVDDPSSLPEEFPTEEDQDRERKRLFGIIEELVKWENSNNERVLEAARKEILKSTDGNPPAVLDPFCGGGSIPLEAQRLGLEAHASDLNPVAVLITKALIEIPPKFANQPPVNPEARKKLTHSGKWKGAQGLADDVRYYGKWMRDEAEKRIGHLYPKVKLEKGREATVIAWLWARTVTCANPACGARIPLVRSYTLSAKAGMESCLEPVVEGAHVRFEVRQGKGGRGTVDRRGVSCVVCQSTTDLNHVRREGRAGRIGAQLICVVVESARGRSYVPAPKEHEEIATDPEARECPNTPLPEEALGFRVQSYGMSHHRDLFTARQLVALTTLTDLVRLARDQVLADALSVMGEKGVPLAEGGTAATGYADAVATYLGMAVSRLADICNALCRWENTKTQVRNLFGRQAIPMVWDFAEPNIFAQAAGDFGVSLDNLLKALENTPARGGGYVMQLDASSPRQATAVVCTDPPYYDNIGYADLSDFFYVWLRRSLSGIFPDLFATLLVPKAQELVAEPFRHGDADTAARYFEEGMFNVFAHLRETHDTRYPMTVFYAFKQSEEADDDGEVEARSSTGWETILEGMVSAGWLIDGTWPLRSELSNRMRGIGSNALASSIVLACRIRPETASIATRRELITALKSDLPNALRQLQQSNIAAVDLAQAAIGPGMAIFSRYAKVIEADGSPMRVRSALQLINQGLDEVLSAQESEYDADTQWAVAWFSDLGMSEGQFGVAETLSKAKNTSVDGMREAGIVSASKGKVHLLARENLSPNWDPATDSRLTIWEVTQHLIRRLQSGGEQEAAELLRKVGGMGEIARDLAYRLYSICERKGWAEEALAYNSLVIAWPEISRIASASSAVQPQAQMTLT